MSRIALWTSLALVVYGLLGIGMASFRNWSSDERSGQIMIAVPALMLGIGIMGVRWIVRLFLAAVLLLTPVVYGAADLRPVLNRLTNSPPASVPAVTNALQQAVTTGAVIEAESAPVLAPASFSWTEQIAIGSFARPVVACGKNGTVFVAVEGAGMGSISLYNWKEGKWAGGPIVKAGTSTAKRTYVPDIAVDAGGWCFVTWRYGNKEGGPWRGPGVAILSPSGSVSTFFHGKTLTEGAARVEIDPTLGAVVMSKNGVWGAIGRDGKITRSGTFPQGSGGEKFDFNIGGAGWSWATAMNGYSGESSTIGDGSAGGGRKIVWADFLKYKSAGSDMTYCSVAREPEGAIWAAWSDLGRLRANSAFDGHTVWPPAALPDFGPCIVGDRCPPRLVMAGGPVYAVYEAPGKSIMLGKITSNLQKWKPVKVISGSQPGACSMPDGRIGVVYLADGALKFKVVKGL